MATAWLHYTVRFLESNLLRYRIIVFLSRNISIDNLYCFIYRQLCTMVSCSTFRSALSEVKPISRNICHYNFNITLHDYMNDFIRKRGFTFCTKH